ncbi:MAG: hypothetical protein GY765_16975 [bacterium]|nr:hypothetical protein [bacterium]
MTKKKLILCCAAALLVLVSGLYAVGPVVGADSSPVTLRLDVETGADEGDKDVRDQLAMYNGIAKLVARKNKADVLGPFTSAEKKKISHWLRKISAREQTPCYQDYLRTLARNISNEDRFSCSLPGWVELEGNRTGIVFANDETYLHGLVNINSVFPFNPDGVDWDKNNVFEVSVYLNRPELTEKFAEYSRMFHRFQARLPFRHQMSTAFSAVIPRIKICDAVPGPDWKPKRFLMIYPELSPRDKDFKIIIFNNLLHSYYKDVLKPVAGHILSDLRLWDMDYEFYLSNIVMSRMAHHLGPVFAIKEKGGEEKDERLLDPSKKRRKKKRKKREKKTKELKTVYQVFDKFFPVLEMMKSQVVGLYGTAVLVENGLMSEDRFINVYTAYLVSLIDRLRHSPIAIEDSRGRPGKVVMKDLLAYGHGQRFLADLVQFNYFFAKEAILYNINTGHLDIDMIKFRDEVGLLSRKLLSTASTAVQFNIEILIVRNSALTPQLIAVLKSVRDIPKTVEFKPRTR